ncbi:hypothetical protein ACFV4N_24040 [Actinosynnema sp. NPDC059797]
MPTLVAACALNPVYAQGMSVAAMSAVVLRVALVDPYVNKVFFDVMMMLEEPSRLFAADIVDRAVGGPVRLDR